ncbi:MAG: type II secretion system protein GspM [Legionellaceae bacterium]|jgi:general secretion pathway protein M|nr:type II secretion system protein GspM [Legionellaceae bacterium]
MNAIKALQARLLQAWLQLNHRERLLLLWGAVCLGLYLAYAAYASLDKAVIAGTQRLSEKKETLAWIKQAETQLSSKHTGTTVLEKSKALAVLSRQLKASSLGGFAYQLEQLSDTELQISFEDVPYQACLAWLALMSKKYKITVKTFNMDRTDTPGLVKWTVILVLNT